MSILIAFIFKNEKRERREDSSVSRSILFRIHVLLFIPTATVEHCWPASLTHSLTDSLTYHSTIKYGWAHFTEIGSRTNKEQKNCNETGKVKNGTHCFIRFRSCEHEGQLVVDCNV